MALTRVGDAASLTPELPGLHRGTLLPTDRQADRRRAPRRPRPGERRPFRAPTCRAASRTGWRPPSAARGSGSASPPFAWVSASPSPPASSPMYPIPTGIIAGPGITSPPVAPSCSPLAVYVQGMAVTSIPCSGSSSPRQACNSRRPQQHPYVLIGLSVMFVLLALSMFGLYTLQLPSSLQTRLSGFSNRQQGGSVAGVAIMGMISGLVCSPAPRRRSPGPSSTWPRAAISGSAVRPLYALPGHGAAAACSAPLAASCCPGPAPGWM